MSFHGTAGAVLESEDRTWTRGEGWTTVRNYSGREEELTGVQMTLVDDGWDARIDRSGPVLKLIATKQANASNDQEFYDRFRIHKEHVDQSIWTLPEIEQEIQALWPPPKHSYRTELESAVAQEDEEFLNVTFPPGTYPQAQRAYVELTRGADAFENEYTVLTRERVVGIQFAPKLVLPDQNSGLIYSTSELQSTFGIPTFIGIGWPAVPSYTPPNTEWGWRYRRRSVEYIESRKAMQIQDWVFAAWSTFIYASA